MPDPVRPEVVNVFESPLYMVRRALRNMRQSPMLCAAAVGTMTVSLLLVAFFALIVLNVQRLTTEWSREIQVLVYLDQVPEERQLQSWIGDLRQRPEVEGVTFVSRREAFERFRQRLQQDADLLDGLDPEFLPASLEISLVEEHRSQAGVEALVGALKKNPDFGDLRYGQDWLERFESFLRLLKVAGAFLGAFLLFAALFIVANTIKLTLYARRDELEVMALVGATPLFIKAPFLLEGALQGALGGALALGSAYLVFHLSLQEGLQAILLTSGLAGITFLPLSWQLLLLAAGVFLGTFGSLLALRRLVRIA